MSDPVPTTPAANPTEGNPTTGTAPTAPNPTATAPTEPSSNPAPGTGDTLLTAPDDKPADALSGAPETYADFTAPEGINLDKEALAQYTPLMKELGLSQESAQKVVDAVAKREADMIKAGQAAWHKINDEWKAAANAEFGTKMPEVRATIGRAIAASGLSEAQRNEFAQAMNLTAAGNNPAFIRMFYALAQKVTEGTSVAPGNPNPEGQQRGSARPSTFGGALYGPNGPVVGGPSPVQ